jgi:hypothetical protein
MLFELSVTLNPNRHSFQFITLRKKISETEIFLRDFQPAVSRMISRSGVCGLNFTKRSSFSTSGLRRKFPFGFFSAPFRLSLHASAATMRGDV